MILNVCCGTTYDFWKCPSSGEFYRKRDGLAGDRTVAVSIPSKSGGRIFFPRVHFLCRLLSGVVFTAVLPHGHVRRPWPLCQKCRWQVTAIHAYTLNPMKSECADYVCSPDSVGTYQGNELTCVEGTPRPQLSLLAEPLWTGSRLKSGNWCARADRKTNKKVQVGNDFFESFPESPLSTESAGDSTASL